MSIQLGIEPVGEVLVGYPLELCIHLEKTHKTIEQRVQMVDYFLCGT